MPGTQLPGAWRGLVCSEAQLRCWAAICQSSLSFAEGAQCSWQPSVQDCRAGYAHCAVSHQPASGRGDTCGSIQRPSVSKSEP